MVPVWYNIVQLRRKGESWRVLYSLAVAEHSVVAIVSVKLYPWLNKTPAQTHCSSRGSGQPKQSLLKLNLWGLLAQLVELRTWDWRVLVWVSSGAAGCVLGQDTLSTLLKLLKSEMLGICGAEVKRKVSNIQIKMFAPERVNAKKKKKKMNLNETSGNFEIVSGQCHENENLNSSALWQS